MTENQTQLISMRRVDGTFNELHLDGLIVRPDKDGAVLVPSEYVLTLLNAGYVWSSWNT
jgi:hypothetical protein